MDLEDNVMLYNFTLYGDCPSLKNNKTIITKPYPRLVSSARVQAWNKEALRQMHDLGLFGEHFTDNFHMMLKVYKPSARKYDLDNVASTVMDLLMHAEFIEDDSQIYILTVYKCETDKKNPRVEITIYDSI